MSRDELLVTFFQECEDQLEVVETGLSDLDSGDSDDETINAIFRAVHSVKGGAGAFALDDLVEFAHKFETRLDHIRSGKLELERDLINLFLRCSDMLADLIAAANGGDEVDKDAVEALCEELGGDEPEEEEEIPEFTPQIMDLGLGLAPIDLTPTKKTFRVTFKPIGEFYSRGNEATLLIRALAELGPCKTQCDISEVPDLKDLDIEENFLTWMTEIECEVHQDEIAEIFEFADADCELTIEEVEVEGAPALSMPAGAEGGNAPVDLATPPTIPLGPEVDLAGLAPSDGAKEPQDEDVSDSSEEEKPPQAAPPQPEPTPAAASAPAPKPKTGGGAGREGGGKSNDNQSATIRVGLDRVERLVNLVGELVVNQAMLGQSLASTATLSSDVNDGLDEFRRLTRDIQESVMAIRAQPVKPLFQRMSRIVREAAQATGKDVRLVTEGSETEIDKTVLERLADPLTHMIRNAVDHGLEMADERVAAGKTREGVVRLIAAHRSGRVMIEIKDDGAGINRKRVRQIAEEKGLISPDEVLSDTEVDNLLFLPGFSTATEVSNLSGRGVGMDVVRKSIQSLGGRIAITSTPGLGTALTISLPLTLAVVDGIVVEVAEETLIVPITSVVETLKVSGDDAFPIDANSWTLQSRGDIIPLIDVGFELGMREERATPQDRVAIVAGNEDGAQSAIVVDRVEDQRQVVIKSLETNYGDVPGIAAATILGDGRIALILDVERVVEGAAGSPAASARNRAVSEAVS